MKVRLSGSIVQWCDNAYERLLIADQKADEAWDWIVENVPEAWRSITSDAVGRFLLFVIALSVLSMLALAISREDAVELNLEPSITHETFEPRAEEPSAQADKPLDTRKLNKYPTVYP